MSFLKTGGALAIVGAIAPPLAVFAPLALSPLFFLAAVVEIGSFWLENRRLPRAHFGAALLFVGFVLWGVLGATWSLNGIASLNTAGKLALMAVLGLLLIAVGGELSPQRRHLVLRALTGGLAAALALMVLESATNLALTRALYAGLSKAHQVYTAILNRPATIAAVLAPVAVGALLTWGKPLWAAILGAGAVLALAMGESMSAVVAGIAGLVVLAMVAWLGATAGRVLGWIAAIAILVSPLLPAVVINPIKDVAVRGESVPSVFHRVAIWQFTATRIAEHPVLGWGLDAARRLPGGHEGVKATSLDVRQAETNERVTAYLESGNIEQMPLHPHSAPLQIWLEAGAMGAALTSALVLAALLGIARRWHPANRWAIGGAFGFAVAALTVSGLSYGAWQTWWLSALWLGSALTAVMLGPKRDDDAGANRW